MAVACDHTGSRVITGSFDCTAKVWNAHTGELVHSLSGHHSEISSVQCNADSKIIATGSIDKTCKLWSVQTGEWLSH